MSVHARSEVTLRRRRPADDPFIARLARSAFAEYSGRDAEEHTLSSVRARGAVTLIATDGDVAVGFVTIHLGRNPAFISAIAVVRARRGIGVGRRLMIAAERLARADGANELRLCTAEANLAALDLFLKCGFSIQRRPDRRYPRGQPLCALHKHLRS